LENLVLLLDVRVLLIMFSIITIVFLIIVIVLWNKLSKLRSNYMSMLNGDASINVEQALIDLQEKNTALQNETENMQQFMNTMVEEMKKKKANLGVYRYNAFAESGNDLSFSIALVDDEQDGLVLSGIHNRDETYVFAKPLEKGQSKYTLSPEEKEAIHRSVQKK
jgi:uncharacterized protein YlxW (UPF0749 family)